MNVAAWLDQAARQRPDHPAVVFNGGENCWTYAELNQRASHVAASLSALGVHPGDRVALFLTNSPDHVAAWFGTAKAGGIVVDVNIILGDEDWAYVLDDSTPAVAVVAPAFVARVSSLCAERTIIPLLTISSQPAEDEQLGRLWDGVGGTSPSPALDRDDDDVAVIAYTSGTTGLPKGVVHTHGLLGLHIDLMARVLSTKRDDVMVTFLPLFPLHAFLCQAALAVAKQATLLVLERFDPATLAELSGRFPISSGTLVPAIVAGLLALPPEARPRLVSGSRFNVGGAPLHPAIRDRFESTYQVTLLQGFGSTEVMGAVAMERVDQRAPWGSCGSLWPGLAEEHLVRVVDGKGHDVDPGEVGEFAVHRSRAMVGYWSSPSQTAEAFLESDWYLMGDVGRIDEDGFVYLLDRKKDMIIRGGFNIYCAEIERVLTEQDTVAEATVVGIAHDRLGEVPKAFIVPAQGTQLTEAVADELASVVRNRLGALKVPDEIEFVTAESLPRNAMGKVLKRELRARLDPQSPTTRFLSRMPAP